MAIVKIINSPRSHTITGLHGTLSYCCREAKTNHEGQRLITGINCVPQFALQEFMNTKRLHKQTDGRMFYHMVQSFPKDENITPEAAHEIALKLAETIPGFEIVVATHCDADHVHSHFVINSVNFETGMKYHSDQQSIHALWDASDKLCLQYGLSVIKRKQSNEHRMNDREYRAYMRGNSWKMSLEIAIDDCMTLAYLAATGARVSELIQIKIEHVELGYFDLYAKGGKLRRLYIPKKLRTETIEWLEEINRSSGYLFLNRYGERITTRGISQQLKNYADKYGLDKKVVYPHSFRHRYAKNFLEKYNDIALLADLMGHESIETTRIYLRRTASEQQALVDKIVTW